MRPSRILVNCLTGISRYLRTCAIITIVIFIIESIIFNTVILYFVFYLGSTVSHILQAPGATFIDKLAVDPLFQNLVNSGKAGGFKTLLQHTLGRVYIQDDSCEMFSNHSEKSCINEYPRVHSLGVDVSGAGEAMFIYRRMQRHRHKPWSKLIVDIGANDGLLSSNSFNFIHWGWSAILVEPQASQLNLASENLNSVNTRPGQDIKYVQAVLGEIDGSVRFKLSKDIVSMESHILKNDGLDDGYVENDRIVQVDSFTVRTFGKNHNIPKHFGILSIDAEGTGSKILHQWIHEGFRPAYIIYEALHDPENIHTTKHGLEQEGYVYLTKLGWNSIFEYNFSKYEAKKGV